MPSTVTEVYKWVVDDVVEKIQELFAQEGVEPSVLNELRETWLKKLHDSGVMGDPNDEPPPRSNLHTDHSRSMARSRPTVPRRITDHRAAFAPTRSNPGNPMAHHLGLNTGLPRVDAGLRQVQTVALGVPQANLSTPAMILSQEYVPGLMTNGYLQWGQPSVQYLSQVQGGQISVLGNLQAVQSVAGNSTSMSMPVAHTTSQPGGVSSAGQAFHPQQYVTPSGYQVARVSGVQTPGIQQYSALPLSGNGTIGSQPQISAGLTIAPNRAVTQGGQVVYSVVQNVAGKRKVAEDGSGASNKSMRMDNIGTMRPPEGGGTSSNPIASNPNNSGILKVDGGHSVPMPGRIPQQDGASDDRAAGDDVTKTTDQESEEKAGEKNNGGSSAPTGGDGPLGDPLGSDEDPPLTDDDEEEEIESANFLTAQYDKVSRIKTRWRCQLKFGIFHANGRDYLFKTASGEFEF
ncbi:hypothetical protein BSKO_03933 [Bryopsis sp. KO-2023]|nr:hypothetical protein BSKO_03933 [Bryopsis sp. KO-2023]